MPFTSAYWPAGLPVPALARRWATGAAILFGIGAVGIYLFGWDRAPRA
jgi:hypothetical protein